MSLILEKGKNVLQGNLKGIQNSYLVNRARIDTNEDIKSYIKK